MSLDCLVNKKAERDAKPVDKLIFWVFLFLTLIFGIVGVFQPAAIGPALASAAIAGIIYDKIKSLEKIETEKQLVEVACHGFIHPDQADQKKFSRWLKDVVIFHLNNLKRRIET